MRSAVALVLLLALGAACSNPAPPAAPAEPSSKAHARFRRVDEKPPDDRDDRISLLTLPRGATIVSRTGELLLDASAVRAIDGDPLSFWMAPPNDLPQSLIVALPARTRIERVGIRSDETLPARHVQFETSTDGMNFTPLVTIASRETADAQWFDVTPVEATHLRVTIVDRVAAGREPRLRSIFARGTETEPPHPGDLAGCWSLNETQARFERQGASASGTIAMGNVPMFLQGGFDGRAYRFNFVRGNDYGYALFAVAPGGRTFSAMEWHEEAIPLFYGESWFGERQPCGDLPSAVDTREKFLARTGRLSLFGIRFADDGSIVSPDSAAEVAWVAKFAATHPVQLVAREFRRADAKANRAFAQRELDALRDALQRAGVQGVTFVARGSDTPRQLPDNDVMRSIYSTVDLEIRR